MPKSVTRTPAGIGRRANRSITAQPKPSSPRKIFPIPATRTRGDCIRHPPNLLAPNLLAPFHLVITVQLLPPRKRTDGQVVATCQGLSRGRHPRSPRVEYGHRNL